MRLLEGRPGLHLSAGESGEALIPPEGLTFEPDPEGEAWVQGREFLGHDWAYLVQWGERRLRLHLPLDVVHSRGQRGHVGLKPDTSGWLFPGGQRLLALPPAGLA
jgi:iron(III) transport system ATP-binding protein